MPRRYPFFVLWLLLLMLPVMAAQSAADELSDQTFDQLIASWNQSLDDVERELRAPSLSRERISVLLANIDSLRQHAAATGAAAAREAMVIRRLLAALGPAPVAGEPGEDQITGAERQRISAEITRYESRYKRCNLILARIDILIENIAGAEREIILRVLQERVPWSFELVPAGLAQLRTRLGRSWEDIIRAWHEQSAAPRQQERLLALAGLLLLSLTAAWLLRGWLLRHYGRDHSLSTPDRSRQLLACVSEFIANGLVPAVLIGGVVVALHSNFLEPGSISMIIHTLLLIGLQWVLLTATAAAALAPQQPQWRVITLSDSAAAGIYRNFLWLLLVAIVLRLFSFMLNPALSDDVRFLSEDGVFTFFALQRQGAILLGGSGLLLIDFIMLRLLRPRYWRFYTTDEATGESRENPPPLLLGMLLWSARLALIGCLLLGFAGYIGAGLLMSARICLDPGYAGPVVVHTTPYQRRAVSADGVRQPNRSMAAATAGIG